MQNKEENLDAFLREYYENLYDDSDKIVDANANTLKKITQNKMQKKLKDQNTFLIALNVFKNSNRETKDYSDILIGKTEELLLDGNIELGDLELQLLLCFMDVYSATNSSSFQMESQISQLEKRAHLFYQRKTGKERLEIVNKIIGAMREIVECVKDTVGPIKNFAKQILNEFENRIQLYSKKVIEGFYDNVHSLERGILSTRLFNQRLRIIEPERFDDKFNAVFCEYIKSSLLSA